MPTSRTYADACSIARALDVVGERWALLVVRELLLGPQRFSDLRRALPGASSNLVADRLRELTGRGVVQQRQLPPPSGSAVYELTPWGRELEPVILALGEWGLRVPLPPEPTLNATSVLLFLRSAARLAKSDRTVWQVDIDGRPWTVRARDGRVSVEPGEPDDPVAGLSIDPRTLNALLADPRGIDSEVASGRVGITGDPDAARVLLASVSPGR